MNDVNDRRTAWEKLFFILSSAFRRSSFVFKGGITHDLYHVSHLPSTNESSPFEGSANFVGDSSESKRE